MVLRFNNSWPVFFGLKPYARGFNPQRGLRVSLLVFYYSVWFGFGVCLMGLSAFNLGFGYEPVSGLAKQHPSAYYFSLTILGFSMHWRSAPYGQT
jgi:hypothetical protein